MISQYKSPVPTRHPLSSMTTRTQRSKLRSMEPEGEGLFPLATFGDFPTERNESFVVDDESKATWAATRWLGAQSRIIERQRLADSYKQRIDEWLQAANSVDQDLSIYMEALLHPWVINTLSERKSRSRSLKLLGVTLSVRKQPDKLDLEDEAKTMDFCESHLPQAIVVHRTLSKTTLKQALGQGIEIPGASLCPGGDELYVKSSQE